MSATKPGAAPSGARDTRLVVTDFGPIARAEVTLRPLTVFVGPKTVGRRLTTGTSSSGEPGCE